MARSVLSRYLDPATLSRVADRPVEPPDWSDALFGERPAVDPLLPPEWISDPGPGSAGDPDDHGEPTPPLGTPRVEG